MIRRFFPQILMLVAGTASVFSAQLFALSPRATEAAQEEKTAQEEKKADDEPKLRTIKVAEGAFDCEVLESWEAQRPRVKIIEHEMTVPPPKKEGEESSLEPGRLTIMLSGGGLEANIKRWAGQFKSDKGEAAEPKVEEIKVSDMNVTLVDLTGTYLDQRGPFAPAMEKENYRMLGAVCDLEGDVDLFFKLTAPAEVAENAQKAFRAMIESIKNPK